MGLIITVINITTVVMVTQPSLGPLSPFSLSLAYTQSVGLLGRGISSAQGHYLHKIAQTQNKGTQTSISPVVFEHTIQCLSGQRQFATQTARPHSSYS